MREFLQEFRDNWRDDYWWADHQGLRFFLIGMMLGTLWLIFHWLRGDQTMRVQIVGRDT